MILKEILIKALDIICDDEINLDIDSKKRQKLISCGNMIYNEIVEEYVPLKNSEELEFVDDRLDYSAFSKPVKDILSIKNKSCNMYFVMYPSYVECQINGNALVRYLYHPPVLNLNDTVVLPPQFGANVMALGVASEYFYRSGLCDEAIFYKNRYDTGIVNITRKRKPIQLKVRGGI